MVEWHKPPLVRPKTKVQDSCRWPLEAFYWAFIRTCTSHVSWFRHPKCDFGRFRRFIVPCKDVNRLTPLFHKRLRHIIPSCRTCRCWSQSQGISPSSVRKWRFEVGGLSWVPLRVPLLPATATNICSGVAIL